MHQINKILVFTVYSHSQKSSTDGKIRTQDYILKINFYSEIVATFFWSIILRACLKRRHVYVAVWPSGRSAEIIEPFYKYYKKFEIL